MPTLAALDPPAWHVVTTRFGRELAVADRVASLQLEAYCPTFVATWARRGRRYVRTYPHFRTYLFARWDAADPHLWHELNDLDGVTGFLGGSDPAPVLDRVVAELRDRVGNGSLSLDLSPSLVPRKPLPLGTRLRVVDGPFEGHEGRLVRPHRTPVLSVEIGGVLSRDVVIEVPLRCCVPVDGPATSGLTSPETTRKRNRAQRGKFRLT